MAKPCFRACRVKALLSRRRVEAVPRKVSLARSRARLRRAQKKGSRMHVIQVKAGSEGRAVELIGSFVDPTLYSECFVPKRELMKKRRGEWSLGTELLFPGYVFAQTRRPGALAQALRAVPAFTRLLGAGEAFIPLTREEVDLVNALTQGSGRARTARMSTAVREGDEVRILQGPLMDKRAQVKRIDERKKLAYLEIEMLGRKAVVKLGLDIIRN